MKIEVHRSKALLHAEIAIAYVLRGGVAASGAVIAVGLGLRMLHVGAIHARSRLVIAELLSGRISPSLCAPQTAAALAIGLRTLDPDTIVALGLILLIALPIIRVGMTIILFLIERDYIYLGITTFVFAVLILGTYFGKAL